MKAPRILVSVAVILFSHAHSSGAEPLRRILADDEGSQRFSADVGDDSPVDGSAVVRDFLRHATQHADGTAAFTMDLAAWSSDISHLPIGVFDSGIGGLTVLEAILSLDQFHNDNLSPGPDGRPDFENERFIYFGDQANMPYGNYSSSGREEFLKELILKDAAFLLGRRYWPDAVAQTPRFDKPPVKAIVIACNTATAWGIDEIRQIVSACRIPVLVVGVVEAGSRGVLDQMGNDEKKGTIAVLATVGTCSSNAYPKAISRTLGMAGKRTPEVLQQGSIGLAGAIEGDPLFVDASVPDGTADVDNPETVFRRYQGPAVGHPIAPLDVSALNIYGFEPSGMIGDAADPDSLRVNSVRNYVRYDVAELVRKYKSAGGIAAIDTIVLGCTHFPLIENEILDSLARLRNYEENGERPFQSLIAESIDIVDPAEMTAKELFRELARNKLFYPRDVDRTQAGPPHQFFISVANPRCRSVILAADGSLDRDYKYGRKPGHFSIEDTLIVPLRVPQLPASSVYLIRSRLPEVWARISGEP